MQVGAQHAVVLGIDPAEIEADPGHAAAAVGQEDQIRDAGCGMRERRRRIKKADAGLRALIFFGIAFEEQLRVSRGLTWGEAGNMASASGNRFNVRHSIGCGNFQRSAKWNGILDEQPMSGRDRSDPVLVRQSPTNNGIKILRARGIGQGHQ